MQARFHAPHARTVQEQPIGGGKQDLEKYEEVEQIAGQECAIQTHQQKLEQRVEGGRDAVPIG
jgi:hypothetical protein